MIDDLYILYNHTHSDFWVQIYCVSAAVSKQTNYCACPCNVMCNIEHRKPLEETVWQCGLKLWFGSCCSAVNNRLVWCISREHTNSFRLPVWKDGTTHFWLMDCYELYRPHCYLFCYSLQSTHKTLVLILCLYEPVE